MKLIQHWNEGNEGHGHVTAHSYRVWHQWWITVFGIWHIPIYYIEETFLK